MVSVVFHVLSAKQFGFLLLIAIAELLHSMCSVAFLGVFDADRVRLARREMLNRGAQVSNMLGLDIEPNFPRIGLQMFGDAPNSEIAQR